MAKTGKTGGSDKDGGASKRVDGTMAKIQKSNDDTDTVGKGGKSHDPILDAFAGWRDDVRHDEK